MEATTINKSYPFEVWVTSIMIGPTLIAVSDLIYLHDFSGLGVVPFALIIGLLFSLPSLLIYYFSFRIIIQKNASAVLIKIVTDAVAILGVVITFVIIHGTLAFILGIIYSISVIISSLIYRINNKGFD